MLAPGGALAVWAYDLVRISPELDAIIDRLGREIVAPYWPPERRWVDELYRTLPFPFAEVAIPSLWIEDRWNLERLLQYTGTWSATQRYIRETGSDPREFVRTELEAAWGDPAAEMTLRWPLMMRAGRPRTKVI